MLSVFIIFIATALTISIYQCTGTLLLCFVHVYVDKVVTVENHTQKMFKDLTTFLHNYTAKVPLFNVYYADLLKMIIIYFIIYFINLDYF